LFAEATTPNQIYRLDRFGINRKQYDTAHLRLTRLLSAKIKRIWRQLLLSFCKRCQMN